MHPSHLLILGSAIYIGATKELLAKVRRIRGDVGLDSEYYVGLPINLPLESCFLQVQIQS